MNTFPAAHSNARTLARLRRGTAVCLGFLIVGVVTPYAVFLAWIESLMCSCLGRDEAAAIGASLGAEALGFGIGLIVLRGALRESAGTRIALGTLLAGVLTPLGVGLPVLAFGIGSYGRLGYALSMSFALSLTPALMGRAFIVSGVRLRRAGRLGSA